MNFEIMPREKNHFVSTQGSRYPAKGSVGQREPCVKRHAKHPLF